VGAGKRIFGGSTSGGWLVARQGPTSGHFLGQAGMWLTDPAHPGRKRRSWRHTGGLGHGCSRRLTPPKGGVTGGGEKREVGETGPSRGPAIPREPLKSSQPWVIHVGSARDPAGTMSTGVILVFFLCPTPRKILQQDTACNSFADGTQQREFADEDRPVFRVSGSGTAHRVENRFRRRQNGFGGTQHSWLVGRSVGLRLP